MSENQWAEINHEYHARYQGTDTNIDDPNWIPRLNAQASLIKHSLKIGLLNNSRPWLDYACGDGKLSEMLSRLGDIHLAKYDEYMAGATGYLNAKELTPQKFGLVITTSVFEHLSKREHLNAIDALVAEDGVLGLHTLVRECIPLEPSWFYLLPVHCAFHTNRSMQILMSQWGYTCSVYNVESRLWFLFRGNDSTIEQISTANNNHSNSPYLLFKNGFVDYWK